MDRITTEKMQQFFQVTCAKGGLPVHWPYCFGIVLVFDWQAHTTLRSVTRQSTPRTGVPTERSSVFLLDVSFSILCAETY
jgi:hypothetical protein